MILFIGGIIGLGEAEEDRIGLLHTLATLPSHPESVPINALVAVKGTPLEDQKVFCCFITKSFWIIIAIIRFWLLVASSFWSFLSSALLFLE